MNDEEFAATLRPGDNIFGVGGLGDYFDSDGEDDVANTPRAGGAPMESFQVPTYSAPSDRAPQSMQGVGEAMVAMPESSTPTTSNGKLGAAITLFCLIGGAAIGWHFGRVKGAAGGALVGGAVRNLYRAQRTFSTGGDKLLAVKQGVIGAAVGAGGTYLLYTADRK
jgi:hypothetical protein